MTGQLALFEAVAAPAPRPLSDLVSHDLSAPHWSSDASRFYRDATAVTRWNGRSRCVLKTDLRDWLHRLDAHGEMRGDQLCESIGSARGESTGFMNSLNLAEQVLAHMERGGWIAREQRGSTSRWVPGPSFDLHRFELWVSADGPQDGSGMFPLEWQP